MKNLFYFLILSLFFQFFASAEPLKDVGIAKYAVLEVNKDNSPLRQSDNENAKRISDAYKNTILYADKQNEKYYRIHLKDDKYGWINKNLVEVQAIIPEKRIENIEKINFKETKEKYEFKIQTKEYTSFEFKETNEGLSFSLFDNRFDPTEIKNLNSNSSFSFSKKIENDFNLNYKTLKPLFGYGVEKFEKGYILTIKKSPKINPKKPLKNIKITLDPGHGGEEAGARAFGYEEKTINLQISKKLKNELKKRGAIVYMTRTKDKKTGLYERIDFANEKNSDILLSIHQNSLPNIKDVDKKSGVGTYYYHKQAYPLAVAIQKSLLEATNFKDDKVNYASFALARPSIPVSVLIECGYIIKKEEIEKLADKKFQKIVAKGITRGIEKYLTESFK